MTYIDNENYTTPSQKPKLQTGLIVLCILTFIGSGLSILTNFFYFFYYDSIPAMMQQAGDIFPLYQQAIDAFSEIPRYSFMMSACFNIVAFVGAAIMLSGNKLGFHLYVVAQILLLTIPSFIAHKLSINFFSVIVSFIFIFLYFKFLPKTEKYDPRAACQTDRYLSASGFRLGERSRLSRYHAAPLHLPCAGRFH